jgi:RimJ/RimL family protein N-acetyltransferase
VTVAYTRRVELVAIREDHRGFLYDLFTDPDVTQRVRFSGATIGPEQFNAVLWDSVLAQFVVIGRRDRVPRGLVVLSSPDLANGYGYVSVVTPARFWGTGLAMEGIGLLIEYAFRNWAFRKLYAEAMMDNFRHFESGVGAYFEVEGRLKQHHFANGSYEDVVTLAIYRERWHETGSQTLTRLGARSPDHPANV